MAQGFSLSYIASRFPTEEACLEEIKKLRYPNGIACIICEQVTKHYKLRGRPAYCCEYCRHHTYPLAGTIFDKSSTSLRIWFFCMFLMTCTRGRISIKALQRELGVTYKTAWRMKSMILKLMKQNHGDLLSGPEKVLSVSFFNAFELKVIQKEEDVS